MVMSFLQPQSKNDANPERYRTMVEEIYYTWSITTPLHNNIAMWRMEKARIGIKSTLTLSNLKCIFMQRQRFLKAYDGADNLPVEKLQELVARQKQIYRKLCEPTDQSFLLLKLGDLLDVHDSFIHLYYQSKDWSVVDTCKNRTSGQCVPIVS